MSMFADATAPPPVEEEKEEEEELFTHDGYGCDANNNDALSGVVLLDEEGFPSQLAGEDDAPNGTQAGSETTPGKSDFAAEFYRCGTDWSCLSLPEDCSSSVDIKRRDLVHDPIHTGKNLKQANLLQIWGFKENCADSSVPTSSIDSKHNRSGNFEGDEDGSGKQNVKPGNWGSISRNIESDSVKSKPFRKRKNTHDVNRPSPACPFYKKIPGESTFIFNILQLAFFII